MGWDGMDGMGERDMRMGTMGMAMGWLGWDQRSELGAKTPKAEEEREWEASRQGDQMGVH
jgi:hypothetical protein